MGGMVAEGDQAVASGWEAGGTQEATVIQGATEGIHQPVPKHRHPQQKAAVGMQPRGGQTHPAPCDPRGRSLLRTPVQTTAQKQPPRQWTGCNL